jgi:hypothetical protein
VIEATGFRLATVSDLSLTGFVQTRLNEEIKRLHNPSSEKTVQLFRDYAGIEVSSHWKWSNVEPDGAKQRLNAYLKLRGDVVHRARTIVKGPPQPHPVTKEDLQKCIAFLKELVKATERAVAGT